jgi:hypothetical protein
MTDHKRREIIDEAMKLLPSNYDSINARLLLTAIAYQESQFLHAHQIGGPAHGYWQFERNGGVLGVLTHHSTKDLARDVCSALNVTCSKRSVFDAIETNPILAAVMARLLLWTHPKALPSIDNPATSWKYYFDTWRPGKPHIHRWPSACSKALKLWGAE